MSKDVLGKAIWEYYSTNEEHTLWVHDSIGPKVAMDVGVYFRLPDEMSELELTALDLCYGKVLDVGAGAGCMSIELEMRGLEVLAIDISPLNVRTMSVRGADNAKVADIFDNNLDEKFDTIILLMNGIGLCGTIDKIPLLLNRLSVLLNDGGQILFDSSDVAFLFNEEDGVAMPTNHYYGEITCAYEYRNEMSDKFKWLYIDRDSIESIANENGWLFEYLFEDESGQYLARLTKNTKENL